jgi:hypothetical protein
VGVLFFTQCIFMTHTTKNSLYGIRYKNWGFPPVHFSTSACALFCLCTLKAYSSTIIVDYLQEYVHHNVTHYLLNRDFKYIIDSTQFGQFTRMFHIWHKIFSVFGIEIIYIFRIHQWASSHRFQIGS